MVVFLLAQMPTSQVLHSHLFHIFCQWLSLEHLHRFRFQVPIYKYTAIFQRQTYNLDFHMDQIHQNSWELYQRK